jgi:hemerythrin-like domain-containing protein
MAQVQRGMLPIGELMIEHRLIDRMLKLMRMELDRIGAYGNADPELIDSAVSFIKEYADFCHHGKEEKILFARLMEKPISPDLKKMVDDLVQEHIFVRNLTNELVRAKDQYMNGKPEGKAGIISSINSIVEFYPKHVEKEEKHFFMPAMGYFSGAEKEEMLRMFREFDGRLLHDEFRMMVSGMEDMWHAPPQ